MKILKTYQSFNESKDQKEKIYEYGCCLLNFDFPEMEDVQDMIDPDDIYSDPNNPSRFGLEDDPHVTLLYGFNDGGDHKYLSKDRVDEILDISSSIDGEILLTNLSIFDNDNYDVLKLEAECEELHRINKDLMDRFDYTTDFPDYKPHCTIAYLKPGTGKKYINKIKKDFSVIPKEIVYSRPNIEGDKKEEFRKKIEDLKSYMGNSWFVNSPKLVNKNTKCGVDEKYKEQYKDIVEYIPDPMTAMGYLNLKLDSGEMFKQAAFWLDVLKA